MRVGVDVGGTFTDLVALAENGTIEVRKVVTTPDDPAVGLFRALDALSPVPVDVLIHGTTIATNALLERRGARIALVTTKGFEDLLWLRRQDRAALYQALPAVPVVASHQVLPVFRELERTSTTTVEAYLRPKVSAYLGRLEREVRARGIGLLRVMTSSGGTLPPGPAATRAASLALSGPAGGVVGARLVGAAVGLRELLTLDMGGTSADASLVTGGTPLGDGGGSVAGLV